MNILPILEVFQHMFKISNMDMQALLACQKRHIYTEDFVFDDLFTRPLNLDMYDNKIGNFYKLSLRDDLASNFIILGNKCKNVLFYPPFGGMGWHTNGPAAGKRIYISWSETGESGMNWYNTEKDIVTIDKDEIGFNIRVFDIPQWHCVWSKCNRFSVGFDIG
jgi:hypothetical protein